MCYLNTLHHLQIPPLDPISNIMNFLKDTIKPKSTASKIFSNPRYTNNNLRGTFVTSIDGTHVLTSADSLKQLRL